MGEVLLAGTIHYPPLLWRDMAFIYHLKTHVKSERVPEHMKKESNWPKGMQEEYGPSGENILSSAIAHRERLVSGFSRVRQEIDVIRNRGGSPLNAAADAQPDPPAPSARLCFDIGAATAQGPHRQPLPLGAHWVFKLVSRIPDDEEPHALAGYRVGHREIRGTAGQPAGPVEGPINVTD